MDIQSLTAFFKWCSIINIAVLALAILFFIAAPDFVNGILGYMFHLPRETLDVVHYAFLGLYKVVILVFNLVPYVALRIIG